MNDQIVMHNDIVLPKQYDVDKSCGLPVGEFRKKVVLCAWD